MTTSLIQKSELKISMPFKYIKKGITFLFCTTAKTAKSSIKKGIRLTGKTVGRIIWDTKLENLYAQTRHNKHICIGIGLIWLFLFSWLGYKVYQTIPANTDMAVSLSSSMYSLLAAICLFCLLRDIKRCAVWNKRENIRETIISYPTEALKQFLSAQTLTPQQKELLYTRISSCDDNKKIICAYEEIVLKEMDKEADKIVEKYAGATGISCAVSPKWSWDYLLAIAVFSKMLFDIAKAYRVKLSLSTFISVFIFGLAILAASTMITQGIKQITEKNQAIIALSGGVGAWISGKIIELAIPCCAMGTLGYALQYALRPIKPHK